VDKKNEGEKQLFTQILLKYGEARTQDIKNSIIYLQGMVVIRLVDLVELASHPGMIQGYAAPAINRRL
jgi:hypothetical protein